MNANAALPSHRWRLRASDFELLHNAGALNDVRRAELIDGDIYGMSPQLARHARAKTQLALAIGTSLAGIDSRLDVMVEVSVIVADDGVLEPDIVVSSYKGDRYVPAATVSIVVEVSDSTLDRDLGRKLELYAAAGISEYWVVDVNEHHILIHSRPSIEGYAERGVVPFGDAIASLSVGGLSVQTASLVSS